MHLYFRLPQFNSNFLFYCKLIANMIFYSLYIPFKKIFMYVFSNYRIYLYAYLSLYNQFHKN